MLTHLDNLTVFLEGSTNLDWCPESSKSFAADNPVTSQRLSISRQKLEQGAYSHYWRSAATYTYVLVIKTGSNINSIYTEIATGDYDKDIDRLLENLFRVAQHKSVDKLISSKQVTW